jgi:hypothetical protein
MAHQLVFLSLEVNGSDGKCIDANESLVLDGEVLITKGYGELHPEMTDLLERALKVRAEKKSATLNLPEGESEWTWDEALEAARIQSGEPEWEIVCAFSAHSDGAETERTVTVAAPGLEEALRQINEESGESLMRVRRVSCNGEPMTDLEDYAGMLIKQSSDEYRLIPIENSGAWIQVGNLDLRILDTGEGASVTYYPCGQGILDSIGESYVFFNEVIGLDEDTEAAPVGPRM